MRPRHLEMTCPIGDCDADVAFTLGGDRESGLEIADVRGCPHAEAYEAGSLGYREGQMFEAALDATIQETARQDYEDEQAARESAWERRHDV